MGGIVIGLMTFFMAMRLAFTHHLRPGPVIFLAIAWTWFAVSYARRHRRAAWRVRGALEDAHALAGLPSALSRTRVHTEPAYAAEPRVAVAEPEEIDDHADALAEFDRRLAASQKGS